MDIRLLFVVLNVLAAVLPFAGVVIAIRQTRVKLTHRRANPVTLGDIDRMVGDEPIVSSLKDLTLSAWLVGGGLLLGAIANVWSLYAF